MTAQSTASNYVPGTIDIVSSLRPITYTLRRETPSVGITTTEYVTTDSQERIAALVTNAARQVKSRAAFYFVEQKLERNGSRMVAVKAHDISAYKSEGAYHAGIVPLVRVNVSDDPLGEWIEFYCDAAMLYDTVTGAPLANPRPNVHVAFCGQSRSKPSGAYRMAPVPRNSFAPFLRATALAVPYSAATNIAQLIIDAVVGRVVDAPQPTTTAHTPRTAPIVPRATEQPASQPASNGNDLMSQLAALLDSKLAPVNTALDALSDRVDAVETAKATRKAKLTGQTAS